MGFLDHLFKNKPGEEKMGERKKGAGEAVAGDEKNADPTPDPADFLRPKRFFPRGGGIAYPPARSVPQPQKCPPVSAGRHEIVITLGDVLSRIPTQLLHAGLHDEKRELRFFADDLSADISRGRAAMPLSRIAVLCPDVFVRQIGPADDLEIRLPLQKLVEQIGRLRDRPMTPSAGPITRPALVPPGLSAAPECFAGKDRPLKDEPGSAFGSEEIPVSPAAIPPGRPPEIIVGGLPPTGLPSELRPHFDPQNGAKVPPPVEKNLPGPTESAPPMGGSPEDAATLEAADGQVALAEFPAQAQDQSLAPALTGEPASEAFGEPPGDPPGPTEVAAQTPGETAEERVCESAPIFPESAADAPAPATPGTPEFHVFTPPPPVVVVAPAAAAENVIAAPDRSAAGSKDRAAAEEVAPASGPQATVQIHPPPIVRPVLVHPPLILDASASAEQAHPAEPVVSSAPDLGTKAPAAPGLSAEKPAAFPQDALQTLFMTDEALDLAAISRLVAALPGVQACALERSGENSRAGELPDGFSFAALHAAAARLRGAAGPLPLGALQNFTLHGDQAAISLFARPGLLLAVLHRALPPGVRERLVTVAAELAIADLTL